MMLYSIIDVQDQQIKDRLASLCDNQPFIAKAPLVFVFVADYRKWLDLFAATDCQAINGCAHHRDTVGMGDLLLACQDAIIAAHTAAIAAESLGLGSCYIGDILEHDADIADLLHLPGATLPLTLLVAGYPFKQTDASRHASGHLVMTDRYTCATEEEIAAQIAEHEELSPTRWKRPGISHAVHALYARKFTSGFMAEMNRSAQSWLKRWSNRT
jgi:hypothetical protein